jgi:hypothetical protein
MLNPENRSSIYRPEVRHTGSLSMALATGKRVAMSAGFTYSHVRAAAAHRTGQVAAACGTG